MISSTVIPDWVAMRAREGGAGWVMAVPVARGAGLLLPRLQVVLGAVLAVLARGRQGDAPPGPGRHVGAAHHLDRPAPRVVDVVAVHVLVELGEVARARLVGVRGRPRRVGLVGVLLELE